MYILDLDRSYAKPVPWVSPIRSEYMKWYDRKFRLTQDVVGHIILVFQHDTILSPFPFEVDHDRKINGCLRNDRIYRVPVFLQLAEPIENLLQTFVQPRLQYLEVLIHRPFLHQIP